MTDTATTVDIYLEAYGEPNSERRAALIRQVFAADASLVDPPLAAEGHEGIDGIAAAVQSQFPGHTFRRTSEVDEHHGFARYAWQLVNADGTPAVAGMDVVQIDDHGRIQRVVGFFGELVPLGLR